MKLFLKIFIFVSLTAFALAQPTPTFSVTANSSGTIVAPSNVKVGLTSQVSGILPVANGGTGTTTPGEIAGAGIAVSGSFPNKTISNTGVTNLVAGTGVTLNTNNGSVTINSTGTGGTVTSVSGTGTVQGISLTGTVTTSGSLTLGGSLSPINLGTQVIGTLNVASGGTGVTSSSGANSVVLRDSNSNVTVNNLFEGFTTITASGTTVTLTVASAENFVVNGSGGQIIKLPDATTLSNGTDFIFNNNQSSGTINVQNNSATTVCTLQSGSYIVVTLLSNSTAAGTWDYHNVAPSNASWSTNTLNWAGSYTNGTWNGNAIGALYGGTGTNGLTGYVYGNGTSAMTASTTIPNTAITGLATVATTGNYNDLLNKPTLNAGSVTSVSVTGNSGVLAGVATATTTPAISIGLGNITPTSISSSGIINISNTTASTSTTTGAIIDAGGLGVGGNGWFGGRIVANVPSSNSSFNANWFNSQILSSSPSTTSIAYVGAVGSGWYNSGTGPLYNGTLLNYYDTSYAGNFSTGIPYAGLGQLMFQNTANGMIMTNEPINLYLGTNSTVDMTISSAGNVSIPTSTSSSSTTSGALTVSGGVGVSGDLFVGGTTVSNTGFSQGNTFAERTLFSQTSISGTNSVYKLVLGNVYMSGDIELELTGYYGNANVNGYIKKRIVMCVNPNNNIYTNFNSHLDNEGSIGTQFVVGDLTWDSTNNYYYIPIYSIIPNSNPFNVRIKLSNIIGLATNIIQNLYLTSPVAGTVPTQYASGQNSYTSSLFGQGFYTNASNGTTPAGNLALYLSSAGNVGIGTSSPFQKLEVNGNAFIDYGNSVYFGNSGNTASAKINALGGGSLGLYAYSVLSLECYEGSNVTIPLTTTSTSTTTGALTVAGGVGVGGNGFFGGYVLSGGNGDFGGDVYVHGNCYFMGGAQTLNTLGYGNIGLNIGDTSHSGYVSFYAPNGNRQGYIGYTNGTGSTDTGTIIYTAGSHYYNGNVNLAATTTSTSTTSGALTVAGGVGIGGNAYVGGYLSTSTDSSLTINPTNGVEIANFSGTVGAIGIGHASGTATGNYYVSFAYNATNIGSIQQVGTSAVAYVTTSDKRLKTPLRSWSLGDKFDNLPIGEFNWLKDGTVAHGTLAQDLYKVYPDAVHVGGSDVKSDPWGVDYGKLTVPLIAEVKTLRSRVKTLEQEQATTTQQLNDLTAKFNQYISTHP